VNGGQAGREHVVADLAAGRTLGIKEMGLALAIAATLVRCVLVPATMTLLGRSKQGLSELRSRPGRDLRHLPDARSPALRRFSMVRG